MKTARTGGSALPTRPLAKAKTKTRRVQSDLAVAGAELHLSNTALEHSLPEPHKRGDVRKALRQNEVVEQKVSEAAEELAEVTELLEEETLLRHHLEQELAKRPPA